MRSILIEDGFHYYHVKGGHNINKNFWPVFKVGYLSAYAGLDLNLTHEKMGLDPAIYPTYTDFCLIKAEKEIPRYTIDTNLELIFVTRGPAFDDFANFVGAAIYVFDEPLQLNGVKYSSVYELDRFGIMPNYQRQGIGTRMLMLAERTIQWDLIHLCTREFQTGKHLYMKSFTEHPVSIKQNKPNLYYRFFYKVRI